MVEQHRVTVAGAVADKPSRLVSGDEPLVVAGDAPRFVSRGGEKLAAALDAFDVDPTGRIVLDVGASTGGFTDCLLQRGAAHVIAVDVGRGQLHERIRADARVTSMERTNARTLTAADLPAIPTVVTMDVSFISATKITPALRAIVEPGGDVIVLVKPQFEAGRTLVPRGGVIRDEAVRQEVLERTLRSFADHGFAVEGVIESPLRGADGNVEYFAHLRPA